MSNYHCRCGCDEKDCAYPKCHNGEYDKSKQVLENDDILERLKASTKVNGAYPRDIADAIAEIERLRFELQEAEKEIDDMFQHMEGLRC